MIIVVSLVQQTHKTALASGITEAFCARSTTMSGSTSARDPRSVFAERLRVCGVKQEDVYYIASIIKDIVMASSNGIYDQQIITNVVLSATSTEVSVSGFSGDINMMALAREFDREAHRLVSVGVNISSGLLTIDVLKPTYAKPRGVVASAAASTASAHPTSHMSQKRVTRVEEARQRQHVGRHECDSSESSDEDSDVYHYDDEDGPDAASPAPARAPDEPASGGATVFARLMNGKKTRR